MIQQWETILERVHAIGREIVAPHADAVDRDARFPEEAIQALKKEKLLSCYIPKELGGLGLNVEEVAKICEVLGNYCGSAAMVFAMHQIQVACIVHHALGSEFFQNYAKELVAKQFVLASATTELGIGGDVRSSLCAAAINNGQLVVQKMAPVISYAEHADAILVTCRKNSDAARNDQIHVLATQKDFKVKRTSGWDTLGFRGTCSNGYTLDVSCAAEQVLPAPYGEIHAKTMHPFSHAVWAALWLGIASQSVSVSRNFVRNEIRKNPGSLPPSAMRLAELDTVLFTMRGGVWQAISEYQKYLDQKDDGVFSNFSFAIRTNNLKVTASTLIVEIVSKAMIICGISGYRNDSKMSLSRVLRDAYGAAVMVNNDRILAQSASIQVMQRD